MKSSRDFFLKRYNDLGHSLDGNERTKQSIRVNTLKTTNKKIKYVLEKKGVKLSRIDYLKHGYIIEYSRFSLGATIEYLLGYYSLQERAAQFPVEVLDPREDEIVLDMCSAPGGKSTQIAASMNNKGILIAVDINRDRLYALENNLERCGVDNCLVYHNDVNTIDFNDLLFDKILLDSPCSGNYVIDPKWFQKRSHEDVMKNSFYQKKLLDTAIRLLKRGGTLVYSTCSLEPEENEFNIQWLIDKYDIKLEKIEGPGTSGLTEVFGFQLTKDLSKSLRFWPDQTKTQGFYLVKLVKK